MQHRSIFTIFIWGLIALIVSRTAEACSCMRQQYQTLFCRADVVVKGTINSKSYIYAEPAITNNDIFSSYSSSAAGDSFYQPLPVIQPRYPLYVTFNMTLREIFKGKEELVDLTTVTVSTAASGAMCGIPHLDEEETYLITGFVWDGEINIGLCSSWVEPFKSLTAFQKRGLRKLYKTTCDDCKVCTPFDMNQECTQHVGCWATESSSCFMRNAICMRSSKGKCSWKKSKYIAQC
ncbi:metalloproteinase inhibitor 3-like [Diadema antillarum]|uniref:metalloproteinase inhibitor 3-like n=1 Tax=Diadema antillarum TaxID=105358 RepID=UPI003A8878FE